MIMIVSEKKLFARKKIKKVEKSFFVIFKRSNLTDLTDKIGQIKFSLKTFFLYYFCYFYRSNWSNRSKKEVFQGVHGFLLMVQFGQIGQKDTKPA